MTRNVKMPKTANKTSTKGFKKTLNDPSFMNPIRHKMTTDIEKDLQKSPERPQLRAKTNKTIRKKITQN